MNQPHDHVKAGGFARAVGTEQSDNFAGLDIDLNFPHDLSALVHLSQSFGPDQAGFFGISFSHSNLSGI